MLFLPNTKPTARYGLVKGNNIVLHFTGNTKVSAAYHQTREQLFSSGCETPHFILSTPALEPTLIFGDDLICLHRSPGGISIYLRLIHNQLNSPCRMFKCQYDDDYGFIPCRKIWGKEELNCLILMFSYKTMQMSKTAWNMSHLMHCVISPEEAAHHHCATVTVCKQGWQTVSSTPTALRVLRAIYNVH